LYRAENITIDSDKEDGKRGDTEETDRSIMREALLKLKNKQTGS